MTLRARVCLSSGICLVGLVSALRLPESSAAHNRTYVVQAGDTLSAIGVRFHSSQRELIRLNGIEDPSNLQAGQVLTVPEGTGEWGGTGRGDRSASSTYTPATTDQVSPEGQPEAPVYRTQTTTYAKPGTGAIYVVQPGDTLGALSNRFGVSMADLSSANGIRRPEFLQAGQRLLIPGRATTVGSVTVQAATVGSASAPSTPSPAASTTITPGNGDMAGSSLPSAAASRADVGALLASAAQTYGVDPALAKAVAWQESGWQMVTASDGGIGVMQLMPATVAWVGPALLGRAINPYNLSDNIQAGVALLASYVHQYGTIRTALIAYNAGPLAITRGIGSGTAQYIANVLSLRAGFAQ